MAADVKITMNTETYGALRALLRYLKDSDKTAFTSFLKGQGRNVDNVPFDDWPKVVAEQAEHHLQSS